MLQPQLIHSSLSLCGKAKVLIFLLSIEMVWKAQLFSVLLSIFWCDDTYLQVQPRGRVIITFTNLFTNVYKSYCVRKPMEINENLAWQGFHLVTASGFKPETF
ncbi:MAG: hypothetical protein ABIR50_03605 [Ginsengibacter sp.]